MKPSLFVGSSKESLYITHAIQNNLYHDAEVTPWSQAEFKLSDTSLQSLLEILDQCDFGVFVFAPDDITKMRNKVEHTVRDNVIFELGLFVGKLGKPRSFWVVPEGAEDLHLPSDLLGLKPAVYETGRRDNNWDAA